MPSLKRFRFGCVRFCHHPACSDGGGRRPFDARPLYSRADGVHLSRSSRDRFRAAGDGFTHEIEANDREWQDFIYAVRSGFIAGHDSSTIGKAFDRHFSHPSWHATQKKDGSMLVVFLGGIPVADTTGTSLESYSNLTLLVFFKFTKGEKTFNFVDMRLGYRDDLLALPTETQQNLLRMAYGGR